MSERPTMEATLLEVARVMARRSTCPRGQAGAVLAIRGRILASGYNGSPSGMPHCDHSCDCTPWPPGDEVNPQRTLERAVYGKVERHAPTCRSLRPCRTAIHAEANAVAFAARHGVATEGAACYSTLAPCLACAQLLVQAGIVIVSTLQTQGQTAGSSVGTGLDLLREAGVIVKLGDVMIGEVR